MKHLYVLLAAILCVITLSGCQSPKEMTLLGDITKVSISESEGYGGINEDYFVSLSDKETLDHLEGIIKDAKRTGDEIKKPDFDLLVEYEEDETHMIHLFLGKEGKESAFMYTGHEKDVYTVSPEATTELRKLLHG